MKKALIIFLALMLVFVGVWVAKSKTPTERPDSYAGGFTDDAWWNIKLSTDDVDAQWILDPEIPENYLPVPGEDELYMVTDENGKIIQYRHRTRQEDGSWVWEDVNPDIPDNYEAVEGLKDVYKVTDADGNVKYYKYIRNDDDTYAFVEVDEHGNILNNTNPQGDEIPDNYVHITGNIYAVKDANGVIIGYKERIENADGTYTWKDIEKPTTDTEKKETSYDSGETSDSSGTGSGIPSGGNLPSIDGTGSSVNPGTVADSQGSTSDKGSVDIGHPVHKADSDSSSTTEKHDDGTYTETETVLTSESSNGWTTQYQTIVSKTYDANGNLLSTKKDGPTAISKTQDGTSAATQIDTSKIASTLQGEMARISTGLSFNDGLQQSILANLNAERTAAGKNALKMTSSSNAMMLAKARAAAMATYDYSDYNSPLYGNIDKMIARFGIQSSSPSENDWRASTSKTADAIHARFMSLDSSKAACLGNYTNVGIAVVEKNGYYYICEIFID